MSNPFDIMTADIFGNPDFTERANFGGSDVAVIVSEIAEDPVLGTFGEDEGVGFFLRVQKCDLRKPPKKNDLIRYRGNEYRAAKVTLDAAGLVYRIDLKSKSSR